jgi:hypothetical protein
MCHAGFGRLFGKALAGGKVGDGGYERHGGAASKFPRDDAVTADIVGFFWSACGLKRSGAGLSVFVRSRYRHTKLRS